MPRPNSLLQSIQVQRLCLALVKISLIGLFNLSHAIAQTPDTSNEQSLNEASIQALIEKRKKAQDYLQFKPDVSLEILTQDEPIHQLSIKDQMHWHINGIWASIYSAQLHYLPPFINKLMALNHTAEFKELFYSAVRPLAVWLRRSGDLENAKLIELCALRHAHLPVHQVISANSFGIIARQEKEYNAAMEYYSLGLQIAGKHELHRHSAALHNSLGITMMNAKRYADAAAQFTIAMEINQGLNAIPGQVINGLNLLLTFWFNEEWDKIARLQPRIQRKLKVQTSPTLQHALDFISIANRIRTSNPPLKADIKSLKQAFVKVDIREVQQRFIQMAEQIDVELTMTVQSAATKSTTMNEQIQLCRDPQNNDIGHGEIIALIQQIPTN